MYRATDPITVTERPLTERALTERAQKRAEHDRLWDDEIRTAERARLWEDDICGVCGGGAYCSHNWRTV